jgi:hypothetical protein
MHTNRNLVPLVETVVSDSPSIVKYRKTIEDAHRQWRELPGTTHFSEMAAQFVQYSSTAV